MANTRTVRRAGVCRIPGWVLLSMTLGGVLVLAIFAISLAII